MSHIFAEASAVIDARPQEVYAVLSDYRSAHPAILPSPYFTGLVVEQGGQGAGTVAHTTMNVLGVRREYYLAVTEPEPGRVLQETDLAAGLTTRFKIEPLDGGRRSQVTITTISQASRGFRGVMEKLLNPPIIRRIYKQELDQLASYLRDRREPDHSA